MINCLETISINFPSENHSTTWMDRRSSESRRGLVALDVVSTEAFQWPAFHPSTCHGRGLWTHQRPQNQVFVWQSSMFCKCCCFSVQLFMVWIGLACVWMCFFSRKIQHLPALLHQGHDVHWMKLRPAYVRTCYQLLWTWMSCFTLARSQVKQHESNCTHHNHSQST